MFWCSLLLVLLGVWPGLSDDGTVAEDIAFPSGITLRPVKEDSRYPDVEKTGSRLFKVGLGSTTDLRQLTISVSVGSYRDPSVPLFRVHPVVMDCVQRAWSELQSAGRSIRLMEGYRHSGGTSVRDRYRQSGTGVAIAFAASETTKDYKAMVVAFLRHCPPLFAPLGRDLGVIVEADRVFVYMTGEKTSSTQSLSVSGNAQFAGIDITAWARTQVNDLTDPSSVPTCSADITALGRNGIHPAGSSSSDPAAVVGPIDRAVARTAAGPGREDFLRLVQFPSQNIDFTVPSATPNCPAAGGIYGNGPTTRCGVRLMAPRMFAKMNTLQRSARTSLSSKVLVVEGWTETTGPAVGLRPEARQLKVRLSTSNTEARIAQLSRLAICVGFDYVKNGGDHLVLAVVKQLKTNTKTVPFPNIDLVPVAAPQESWESLYKTPEGIDPDDYPLYDSLSKSSAELSVGAPSASFKSRENDVRYFRISPTLVKCYTEVVRWENRGSSSTSGAPIKVKIVRAFMSNMQEKSSFNPIYDPRLNKHTLGIGMHLAYDGKRNGFDQWRLARTVATVCPAVFQNREGEVDTGRSTGMGIYADGVYVDMRETVSVWLECVNCDRLKPPGPVEEVTRALESRIAESRANRIIDPTNHGVACKFDNPPKPQSPNFEHRHSEAVRRVRRSTRTSPECQLNAPASSFCQKSRSVRQEMVIQVWAIITRKHLIKDKAQVKAALDGCLLSCTKCTTGPAWDAKVQHCNNLIHWIPFECLNDRSGKVTNLFPRTDETARQRACEGGQHCMDLSPIFAIFYPALESKFRPVPGKANKEMVYDPVDNPSPLLGQIARLYALMARGNLVLWFRSEQDVSGMEEALRVLFVYNRNVQSVRINVLDPTAKGSIISALESNLEAWRTTTCPTNAREALTPYSIGDAPAVTYNAGFEVRHRLRRDARAFEDGGLRRDFI